MFKKLLAPPSPPGAGSDGAMRGAVIVIAVIVAGAALWWLRDILTPLVLAIFLLMLIDGFAKTLTRRIPKLPRIYALWMSVAVFSGVFALSVYLVAESATGFARQLTEYAPRLHGTIVHYAAQIGVDVPPSMADALRQLNPGRWAGVVAQKLQGILSAGFFVLIYLGFLLASRSGFKRKLVTLFPDNHSRDQAVETITRITHGVERYIWVQTVTGLMIAGASWAVMAIMGLDNAFLLAFIIFLASYIPVIGGAVGVTLPPLFALMQFTSFWPAVILFFALQFIFTVVGNVITPKMQGDSLNLDPVVVLLSLAFWGAIWGAAGAFLSSPLTVVVMVILAQFPGARWIAVLLSWDGDPYDEKDEREHARHGHKA